MAAPRGCLCVQYLAAVFLLLMWIQPFVLGALNESVMWDYNNTWSDDNGTDSWDNSTSAGDFNVSVTTLDTPQDKSSNGTKRGGASTPDDGGFFKREMIIGLGAGFTFFIIVAILCCVGWSAIARMCGGGKNKVAPDDHVDLRATTTNNNEGDPEAGRKTSVSTEESAFRREDHTTVTSSHGQFTALDSDAPTKSTGRSLEQHSEESDPDEEDAFANNESFNPNARNPFKSRGESQDKRQQDTKANSNNNVKCNPFKSRDPNKLYQATPETEETEKAPNTFRAPAALGSKPASTQHQNTNTKPQGSKVMGHGLHDATGQGQSDQFTAVDFNYTNSSESKPRKQFKAIDLRF